MPQLNPDPWFMILIVAWVAFLVIIPVKILTHVINNEIAQQTTDKLKTNPWGWPWA
uniref:ATP synthase complex subunit 8 n=1 Tax=Saccopharynx lavenbergi TaxID=136490 RepID=Q76MH6_9TELE|nr:ATPase subunits 8 [Saccopharynx lavenbergi]